MAQARASADPTISGANVNFNQANPVVWIVVGAVAIVALLIWARKK
jgi:hypothetical protein